MDMRKISFIGLAAVSLMGSSLAIAEDAQQTKAALATSLAGLPRLTDQQLDGITAGGAFTITEVSNPGNTRPADFHNNGIVCVNCLGDATVDSKTVFNSGNASVSKGLPNRILCINC